MVSAFDLRGLRSRPDKSGHCVVFLSRTLYSQSGSLHPGPGAVAHSPFKL